MDGYDHLIPLDSLLPGATPQAICDHHVWPAPLVEPAKRQCPRCALLRSVMVQRARLAGRGCGLMHRIWQWLLGASR